MSKFSETVESLEAEQKEIVELQTQLQGKLNAYKVRLKQTFGITDGEQMNVLEVLKAVSKVVEMSRD